MLHKQTKRDFLFFVVFLLALAAINVVLTPRERVVVGPRPPKRVDPFVHIAADRLSEGYNYLKWSLLQGTRVSGDKLPGYVEGLRALEGKPVLLLGFPTSEGYLESSDWYLLPIPVECLKCQSPPKRDLVRLELREGTAPPRVRTPILVGGTLALHATPDAKCFYTLRDAVYWTEKPNRSDSRIKVSAKHKGHVMD